MVRGSAPCGDAILFDRIPGVGERGRVNVHNRSTPPSGARAADPVYASVTARELASLSQGLVPWRWPWQETSGAPANALTGRPYRGVNVVLLGLAPYQDHRWLTFRQCRELGGRVRKGERSTEVVFWKSYEVPSKEEGQDPEEKRRGVPLLRLYRVFNVGQCEGLDLPDAAPLRLARVHGRIPRAEATLRAMPDPPTIWEGERSAWYSPKDDLVGVPGMGAFASADAFYATLFHEAGHATGHPRRLARPGICERAVYGTSDYSREELVAELASTFVCAAIGLDNSLLENSSAYVGGWLRALGNDARAVVVAFGQAQRAAEWVFGRTLGDER
ncbi:zincin-like metallopeptidase domain-containing protein [soil metagenome]